MTKPIAVTDSTFEQEVVKAEKPVLVDFWAEWCYPCKMIAPIVEELSQEYDGKIKFAKLDVDSNPQISTQFGIRSIPTLLVFRGGKPVDQVVGAVPKAVLRRRLEAVLAKV
ncbi:MAG: thioredoxin [Chloroflexi bacterium]|nr:thioredoxin [Chloroflexota bacterium]